MTAFKAIVTGASSGIGLATARRIHGDGGSVALLARRESVLAHLVDEFGDRAWAIPADVSNPDEVGSAIEHAFTHMDDVNLVVNCAGVVKPASLAELDVTQWNHTIAVNLSGAYLVSRAAALRMVAGSIINVGSELGSMGMAMYIDYCASKAGLIGLTRAMAAELAPRGIRVNAVCPGPVDTPMMDEELAEFPDPDMARQTAMERVPLARFATPNEVAETIVSLANTTYATGAAWAIDGGTTAV